MSAADMLVVDGVSKVFAGEAGFVGKLLGRSGVGTRAVDEVSLTIRRGEMFGLVGESGCGKSTLARMIAGLTPPTQGQIALTGVSGHKPRLQMIFQDPFSSLNGRWTVGRIVAEPIRVHGLREGKAVEARVHELLEHVGLSAADAYKYPQEFSGGQRQRISIARALAGEPDFLVLDEPTSALDVSVQAQILKLLDTLQSELHLTSLFITHNLSIVRLMTDRLAVMYLGRIVEEGPTEQLFRSPRHPYTRLLMDAAPDLDTEDRSLHPIPGDLPKPGTPMPGCRFANRCPRAADLCKAQEPAMTAGEGGERFRCHFPLD
ncbi:ABC transporter ATP-binding protein [uncultured Alsobacter sp.]|uniref:ABC transporter ATP-binding protein n=1 Tax=uncultured Alsobacter sp. TaxID=1748258 RepID=UPI0025F1DC52|nr:ABC transporter ATP-binding protein [uncultured Alsobacter sp.]